MYNCAVNQEQLQQRPVIGESSFSNEGSGLSALSLPAVETHARLTRLYLLCKMLLRPNRVNSAISQSFIVSFDFSNCIIRYGTTICLLFYMGVKLGVAH